VERELYSLKNIIDFYENTENRKDLFAILNRDNRRGDHFLIGYGGDVIETIIIIMLVSFGMKFANA